MKYIVLFIALCFVSCSVLPFRTLNSTTYIKANDAFLLGNNEHGRFTVALKNNSKTNLTVWRCPIAGGQHSPVVVPPANSIRVSVERNTALRIDNESDEQATVELVVKGDIGLSMGYKN